MLDNITALNIDEELINNKTVKTGVGKYSKPAKLSSGKTFRAKTKEVMSKINNPVNSAPEAAPSVEQAQTVAEQVPAPSTTEPVEQAKEVVNETPAAPTELPTVELPTPEKVLEKVEKVGISVVTESSDGSKVNSPAKKLKVNEPVRDRVRNTYKVAGNVPQEEPKQETEPTLSEEVQIDPEVNVAPAPTEAPEETDQSNFFLGQKINTEEVEQEEIKDEEVTIETPEAPQPEVASEVTQPEVASEVTQEEKDEKLNQYLNSNQETVQANDDDLNLDDVLKDLDDYKKASEQIFDRQSEINKLNKDLEDAKKMLAEKKKEAQQMLGDARKILEEQKNEITSKTQELSDVRDAIIRWTQLKEKNQSRSQEEETSLGKVA